ncbi:TatD family hydrolase [Methyloversatilis sp.]|uniref:TatD family hydrolase n=1 Tax=Methyloversatilis sp. TaxID=2569862 RepID=UPI0027323C6B|nr:TatD family hydrolase [Methyloversatilis sp.]MDP2868463.1 TatD family hydrolase [Methyloversatilis sp.]MDP3454664.1 TatD family hydrolase [Methyloversatilis sp.]MDP3579272.1 TatD family hydrolase [Methyloversatilis sp.]
MFIDSHCHIDFPDLAVREDELLANMRAQQVSHALCVSVNIEQWPRVTAMADRHDNVYASLGVHPDYEDVTEPDVAQLVKLSDHPRVVAIGETGLDYFRLTGDLEWQRARFRTHIRAARECGKPLIIHTRSAAEDTLAIMREEKAHEVGGVMHCFTESLDMAEAAIDMGFCISFSGIITFKNAQSLRDVARAIPARAMLIETDSPYLAPVPYRGKMNEPAFVPHVAAELARVRDLSLDDVARITSDNFFRVFGDAARLAGRIGVAA